MRACSSTSRGASRRRASAPLWAVCCCASTRCARRTSRSRRAGRRALRLTRTRSRAQRARSNGCSASGAASASSSAASPGRARARRSSASCSISWGAPRRAQEESKSGCSRRAQSWSHWATRQRRAMPTHRASGTCLCVVLPSDCLFPADPQPRSLRLTLRT
jgi:hypothetical protein